MELKLLHSGAIFTSTGWPLFRYCLLTHFANCRYRFLPKKVDYGSTSEEGAILAPPPQKKDHFYTKTGWKWYPTGAKIVPLWHSGTVFMKQYQVGAKIVPSQKEGPFPKRLHFWYGGAIIYLFLLEKPQSGAKIALLFKKWYRFQHFFLENGSQWRRFGTWNHDGSEAQFFFSQTWLLRKKWLHFNKVEPFFFFKKVPLCSHFGSTFFSVMVSRSYDQGK